MLSLHGRSLKLATCSAGTRRAAFQPASGTHGRRRRPSAAVCSMQAAELLSEGRAKHDRGDRMGAVMMYERALKKDPSLQQRQEALYLSTCAHAYTGDVEFAQVTLRDAILAGLDFEAAMQDPALVKLQASQQVMIQLRKFAARVQRGRGLTPEDDEEVPSLPKAAAGAQRLSLKSDVSQLLGTELTGLDTSVGGVVKRVALLLLALITLGVVLFYVGFKYTFPEAL